MMTMIQEKKIGKKETSNNLNWDKMKGKKLMSQVALEKVGAYNA